MADLPLLFFPAPAEINTQKRSGRGPKSPDKPSAADQYARLNESFQQISKSFQQASVSEVGVEPEQVIVLETIGEQVEGLAAAAAHIAGLEWLAEMDLDDVAPENGFAFEGEPDKNLPVRLYAVMSNQQAMAQLVSRWEKWCTDPTRRAETYFGPLKNLFKNLKDIRRWNAADRIRTTKVLEYLQERLQDNEQEIRFEVELWCRINANNRQQAYDRLSGLVAAQGGSCLQQSVIPEISYHGVLVSMPGTAVQRTVDGILEQDFGQLVRCEDVMFFRPFAQAVFDSSKSDDDPQQSVDLFDNRPLPAGEPIVAIFDGLPLEQHIAVRDRLIIDDEDSHRAQYAPDQQRHGTAMASLVLHGDLNEDGAPLRHPVYLRPILVPKRDFQEKVLEVTPDSELLVDLVHRSVRRLFEGKSPAARTVKLINLSVANPLQPFDREMSPLGRLIDWLSWKYKVLFLVSVGNHGDDIVLDASYSEWQNLSAEELCSRTLHALQRDQRLRRPFAPSESINALTVGAMHADSAPEYEQGQRTDLFDGKRMPSPLGTFASGFRRSIKPEIYFPGGRQLYIKPIGTNNDPATFRVSEGPRAPGQLVASPGNTTLELGRTSHSRGTSNATALATRLGGQIYERLTELRQEPGGDQLDEENLAVVLKCLLVHGATQGDNGDLIDEVFREKVKTSVDSTNVKRTLRRIKDRLLGYGEVMPERALFSNDERVTVVGWSEIHDDQGHIFQLPLPEGIGVSNVTRRLTGTLAWISPLNSQHRSYRQAKLWFDLRSHDLKLDPAEAEFHSSRRGTVEHRVWEGNRVLTISNDDTLEIKISCKADAGKLTESIPYAFAVTLEVAEPLGLGVSIFEQIRDRVRQRIEV